MEKARELQKNIYFCFIDYAKAFGEAIPLRGLEGVPGLPGAPQDEAGLTRKFETSHVGGATPKYWSFSFMLRPLIIASSAP